MRRRRTFYLFVSITMALAMIHSACSKEARTEGYGVVSDIDPLRRVIVLEPGEDNGRQSYWYYADDTFMGVGYDEGAVAQHREMIRILKKNGIEVLDVRTLLNNALANARAAGELEQILEEIFPRSFPFLEKDIDAVDAEALLGRKDEFYYVYDEEGRFTPPIEPAIAFTYTRDFAVMTPRGLILTNGKMDWRSMEHVLGRFAFRYADGLKDCPIAFDAELEGVRCEGGDILVKDENTLLMGIHNLSDADAAAAIARKLDMDVIGVAMPPFEDFSGANVEIMHLDTVFNLVDENKFLTVPFLFEERFAGDNPIANLLRSVDEGLKLAGEIPASGDETDDPANPEAVEGRDAVPEDKDSEGPSLAVSLAKAVKHIPDVGWLTRFEAGSGEAEEMGTKLVDFLRERGYSSIWVGGEQGDMAEDKYIMERVFYELSLQAANVVQLAPGKVLSYAHNRYTIQALRDEGIEVLTFEGKYLADGLGGPHCLTMPLLRVRR